MITYESLLNTMNVTEINIIIIRRTCDRKYVWYFNCMVQNHLVGSGVRFGFEIRLHIVND